MISITIYLWRKLIFLNVNNLDKSIYLNYLSFFNYIHLFYLISYEISGMFRLCILKKR